MTVGHPRLAQLGQRLATTHGRRPPEAVWFLLADMVPLRWPLSVDTDTDGDGNVRITVSAALYVPTSAITAAINELRRRLKARATRQRIKRSPLEYGASGLTNRRHPHLLGHVYQRNGDEQ